MFVRLFTIVRIARYRVWERILKDLGLYVAEKTDGGSEFHSLEVIGINVPQGSVISPTLFNIYINP